MDIYVNDRINALKPYYFMYNGQRYNAAYYNGKMLFGSKIDDISLPLNFTALENNCRIGITMVGVLAEKILYYSLDNMQTWTSYIPTSQNQFINVPIGSTIYWMSNSANFSPTNNETKYYKFVIDSGKFSAKGNIMSLIGNDWETNKTLTYQSFKNLFLDCNITTAPVLPATTLTDYCYAQMFRGCTLLTSAPALPATTLTSHCYGLMFYGCNSLTTAPELSSTILAEYCYSGMFYYCSSLINAPILPATTLSHSCYSGMFHDCSSLTTAPALPATTLADYCYDEMFRGCTSLTTAPELPAKKLTYYCYADMFEDCTSLTTPPELPAGNPHFHVFDSYLNDYCYSAMFRGCTSLTTAPELPADLLERGCYRQMFMGCTSLTTAPELPAITLVQKCYEAMFYGCRFLNYIKVYATDGFATGNCLYAWLYNVASTGTFNCPNGTESIYRAYAPSAIPSGWTVHTF